MCKNTHRYFDDNFLKRYLKSTGGVYTNEGYNNYIVFR